MRKPREPNAALTYRTPLDLDPTCLLDALAAAGAALITEERFSFSFQGAGVDQFPEISKEEAEICLLRLREPDPWGLAMGDMDFLRGAGQLSTLGEMIGRLSTTVKPADIIAWREHRAEKVVSLRLENEHVSDRPAAYRAQGSSPIERYSHPGRNALAALALLNCAPSNFMAPKWRYGEDRPFYSRRVWCIPLVPISWSAWQSMMGAKYLRPGEIVWLWCGVKANGKFVTLAGSGAPIGEGRLAVDDALGSISPSRLW